MLADSLHNLLPLPLPFSSISISILLLPLTLHLLWRLLPSPHKPTQTTTNKHTKHRSSFYTPTTPDSPTTTITPLSTITPSTLPSLPPDRWYLDPSLISPSRIYTPTMALRPCAPSDWLRLDALHPTRMAHKRAAVRTHGWQAVGGALACRPEADGAVEELVAMLGAYLPARFPGLWSREDGGRWLRNAATGERFEVVAPWGGLGHPLEVVAGVVEEDVAVLMEGGEEDEEEYVLKAAVSAFPAGFDIQDKIGRPLTAIHEPVPAYREKLRRAMNKFFKKVTADRLVMRVNWGINEREELFFLDGTHLYEGDEASADPNIDIDQVQLRVERQVLRRLPKSGAICMLTKTYVARFTTVDGN
ncbi:hypothetical protein BK809_0004584 [Diplodia seriata]|uniref:Uncharacterized protein n=1 Tax=Diplodia seriata TaxID=420778 RepID=A0A1S8B721_9PEZI|nr:hypothetical protein BK809_0004584 [Diplodia seriata]